MVRIVIIIALSWLATVRMAGAEDLRYFAVWDYLENVPAHEISAEQRSGRKLGYWALRFGDDGGVLGGTYHGSDGGAWLSIQFVELEGKIYADLFSPDGMRRARKSTRLSTLKPNRPQIR